MQRPVHRSFGLVKTNMDAEKYGWTGGGRVKKTICEFIAHTFHLGMFTQKICHGAAQQILNVHKTSDACLGPGMHSFFGMS